VFDSRWCHWNFSLTYSFRPQYDPGVDSASNRNEYQEYFLGCKGGWCVGLTTLPPSSTNCLEIWEPQLLGTLRACNGIALPLPYFSFPAVYFLAVIYLKLESFGEEQWIQSQLYFAVIYILCSVFRL
jgi:hypothetical protein